MHMNVVNSLPQPAFAINPLRTVDSHSLRDATGVVDMYSRIVHTHKISD